MHTLRIDYPQPLDFNTAKQLADAAAEALIKEEPFCLSWLDRLRNIESPGHVSECGGGGCELHSVVAYAANRGGTLLVEIRGGEYLFCYRPV